MARTYKRLSTDEWNEIKKMRSEGATIVELSKMYNCSRDMLQRRFRAEAQPMVETTIPAPRTPREKTLHDFTPRQMIRHLYNMGFRIEGNQIILIEKKVINIESDLNED